ncbi:MBL fold metallo-hydrolase [Methylopila sp. 73B]|uniref:MBL fold metallo-hydrolase n=1 Tax=Methylopila sp. 73B TaxID=1120792 RepID=UPI00035DF5D7|nr:MBL fold metallo-hydrolase [Methylopila sp. 73B]
MTRRGVIRLGALLAASAAAGGWSWLASVRDKNPYYAGAPTDHFDGVRFFNPDHQWSKSFGEALRGVWFADKATWPESFPSPFDARPPAKVEGDRLRVTLVGHATHLIQTQGLNILIDPVWSKRCSPVSFAGPKRVNPPGVAFDALPKIDAVLITHNHYDHLDLDTLSRLAARDRPRVIVPLGNDAILKAHDPAIRREAYDWRARVPLSETVVVNLVPSYHWSARGVFDRRKALWCGFVIDAGGAGKLYAAGDTALGPRTIFPAIRAAHGPFKLAILPIGAYEPRWFMKDQHANAAEAVEIMGLVGAENAVGCHWGTFQLTSEAIEAPAEALAAALAEQSIPADRFRALRPGEVWEG